jgi:hypothetical protein
MVWATPALASHLDGGLDSITIWEVSNGNLKFVYIVLSPERFFG